MFHLKTVKQKESLLIQSKINLYLPFMLSTDWVGLTHIKEGDLLYSVYQFKY